MSQSQVSLTSVKASMETARRQLEAYSLTLTELVSKIGMLFVVFGDYMLVPCYYVMSWSSGTVYYCFRDSM